MKSPHLETPEPLTRRAQRILNLGTMPCKQVLPVQAMAARVQLCMIDREAKDTSTTGIVMSLFVNHSPNFACEWGSYLCLENYPWMRGFVVAARPRAPKPGCLSLGCQDFSSPPGLGCLSQGA